MRYLFLFLAGLSLFHQAVSQQVRLASETYPEHRYYPLRGKVYSNAYIQIKGNPYLTSDWVVGNVYLSDGSSIPKIIFKFDTYAQEVILYNDELNRLIKPETNLVAAFQYSDKGNRRYFKRVYSDLGVKKVHSGYFLDVLQEGNIALYKLYRKMVLPLREPEMPFIDEFIDEERYYIFKNGTYEIAHINKSYLKQKFPEYKKEISRYARKNKLKLKNETDFAKMISYLGQLESLIN